jgi:Tfp pilus assembly protein PilO
MAEAKMPTPGGAKADAPRLTGLKKRQQIELAGRNMFAWVVVAAVAVSFCLATGQFLFSKWQYNNNILNAKSEASNNLAQNIVNAKKLKDEVDSLVANSDLALVKTDQDDSNLKSILDALPTTADPAALATSLQQAILSRSGVTVESITVPPETDTPTEAAVQAVPQEIKFSFVVTGTYDKVATMVKDLERTIRPIKITGISLNGTDANLRASIEAVTYYQPSKSVNATEELVK